MSKQPTDRIQYQQLVGIYVLQHRWSFLEFHPLQWVTSRQGVQSSARLVNGTLNLLCDRICFTSSNFLGFPVTNATSQHPFKERTYWSRPPSSSGVPQTIEISKLPSALNPNPRPDADSQAWSQGSLSLPSSTSSSPSRKPLYYLSSQWVGIFLTLLIQNWHVRQVRIQEGG